MLVVASAWWAPWTPKTRQSSERTAASAPQTEQTTQTTTPERIQIETQPWAEESHREAARRFEKAWNKLLFNADEEERKRRDAEKFEKAWKQAVDGKN